MTPYEEVQRIVAVIVVCFGQQPRRVHTLVHGLVTRLIQFTPVLSYIVHFPSNINNTLNENLSSIDTLRLGQANVPHGLWLATVKRIV